MSEIQQTSPLLRFGLPQRVQSKPVGGVRAGERAFCGYVNLRCDPALLEKLEGFENALGVELPVEPNTVAEGTAATVFWLGPDEWLVVTQKGAGSEVAAALREALRGQFAAVTEVTGGYTLIELSGEHARDLLAKGCTLDLHPRSFGPGRCAQSLLAKAPVLLRQVDEAPSFELVVRRSFADYLWHWLEEESRDYGLAVSAP